MDPVLRDRNEAVRWLAASVLFASVMATLCFVLFLDYDGTLVPIAPTPDAAVPSPMVTAVLRQLRARGHDVVIVTGRSAATVRDLLGLEDLLQETAQGEPA